MKKISLMKALDWVETSEKTNSRFWLVWLPDHISMQEPSHAEVLHMLCTCAAAVSVIYIDYRHKYCAYICHKPWLCHKAKARILHLDHSSMMIKPLCKRIAGVPTRFGLFEKMPITMATRAIPYWFDVRDLRIKLLSIQYHGTHLPVLAWLIEIQLYLCIVYKTKR